MKAILTDIEGTTTSIDFVTSILFPFARKNMSDFIKNNQHDLPVNQILKEIEKSENIPAGDVDSLLAVLNRWMDEDKKIASLKTLQGLIWEKGYHEGSLKGHLYEDTFENLKKWKENGLELYVFSSGSILAQKLLFTHTCYGDLTSFFTDYFDTTIGSKKDTSSYEIIAKKIGFPINQILFLSDIEAELNAAQKAGMHTLLVSRQIIPLNTHHRYVQNFNQIKL